MVNSSRYGRKVVLLSSTNAAYLDFTHNWLASIRRIGGALPYTVIVAEDEDAYENLLNVGDIHVVRAANISTSKTLDFWSPEYNKLVNKRPEHILNFLLQGYDILYSDVDTVWLENPFPYFEGDEHDLFVQIDPIPPDGWICTGFMFFKCNNQTIDLVFRWMEFVTRPTTKGSNQPAFNQIINDKRSQDLNIKNLDIDKFVSGKHYFNNKWRRENPDVKPVVLHNNFIVGHDTKVARFKLLKMWYI